MSKTSHELTKEKIDDAIGLCKSYAKTRRSQMQRGLNDFNVFTCLLEEHDEVRLHSRFIHSLLDINGAHGQGDFFLGLFLKECKLDKLDDDEGMDLKNCRVYKEYNNIDLYITDGSRHIIIENKIYAGPQRRQIARYIETIKKKNPDDDLSKNLVVVYLSLNRDRPDKKSLGKYRIDKDKGNCQIVNGAEEAEKYRFLSIHYNKEILDWIRSCKTQVSNITNLSIGLTQYEEVILSLYGQKKDKLMNLKDYIKENKSNEREVLHNLREVNREYALLREPYIQEVLDKSRKLLEGKIPDGWEVEPGTMYSPKRYWKPVRIKQKKSESEEPKQSLAFLLEFHRKNGYHPIYGIARTSKDVDLKWLKDDDDVKDMLKNCPKLAYSSSDWWIGYSYYHKGDMFDFIVDKGGVGGAVDEVVTKFWGMFENYKEFVEKRNKEYLSRSVRTSGNNQSKE